MYRYRLALKIFVLGKIAFMLCHVKLKLGFAIMFFFCMLSNETDMYRELNCELSFLVSKIFRNVMRFTSLPRPGFLFISRCKQTRIGEIFLERSLTSVRTEISSLYCFNLNTWCDLPALGNYDRSTN